MSLLRGALLQSTVFLLLIASVCGQASGVCTESVIVNVRDHLGQLVADLLPSSFHATLGSSVLSIRSANVGASPRIVLLLDRSASMNQSFAAATTIAGNFVASNAVKAHISVVPFSDHVIDTIGFDTPKNEILKKLSELRDGHGHTAFYDSLIYGAGLFGTPEPGDAIYAITDGGDNQSKSNESEVEREFLSKGVRLFAFVLYDKYFPTQDERSTLPDLVHLAEMTGGAHPLEWIAYRQRRKGEQLGAPLQSLYEAMERFYRLELGSTQHRETILVETGSARCGWKEAKRRRGLLSEEFGWVRALTTLELAQIELRSYEPLPAEPKLQRSLRCAPVQSQLVGNLLQCCNTEGDVLVQIYA